MTNEEKIRTLSTRRLAFLLAALAERCISTEFEDFTAYAGPHDRVTEAFLTIEESAKEWEEWLKEKIKEP